MRKTVIIICLSLVCLIFLLPFLYAFGFCYPRGDDYDGITRSMFLFDLPGALYEAFREWLAWSGRYTYHFLAVFLGKAAESPLSCGLVCAFVLFIYGLAFFRLGRLADLGLSESIPFSLAALCVLMACHGRLQDFYLLTDALTIILQNACFFIFLIQLLELWRTRSLQKESVGRKTCVFWGLVAIGIYEHAALAVFWATFAALFSTWLPQVKKYLPEGGKRLRAALLSCSLWLGCGFVFSFLSPGNLARKEARNVDAEQIWAQICDIPADWLDFFTAFLCSGWPLAALCLSALARLGSSQKDSPHFPGRSLAAISFLYFLLFSLSVTSLHALSDVPLLSEGKLCASLEIYAAASLGLIIFFLPWQKFLRFHYRRMLIFMFCLILIAISGSSDNFISCAKNAANGQMLLYGDFMTERGAWLAHVAARERSTQDKFGLAGEIENPGSRRRRARPENGEALVQSFPRKVFPVHMLLGLSQDVEGWPNLWAAWVYGLGALAELPPDPQDAVRAVKKGKGILLDCPAPLSAAGLTGVWLVLDRENPNPTFHDSWLVLSSTRSLKVKLLLPSVTSALRFMPIALQRKEAEFFENNEEYSANVFTDFFALTLEAELKGDGELTAIWLGPSGFGAPTANYLFASINDLVYHKLTAFNEPKSALFGPFTPPFAARLMLEHLAKKL